MEMLSVKNFSFQLLIVLSFGGMVFSQCFNCVKLYHRHEDGTCPQDETGCTSCINGSVIDPENLSTCLELNVTVKPAQATRVTSGEMVILPCLLTAKVECLWKKDGQVIDFAGHPRYQLKIQTEVYTTDCSLIIYNASAEDEGQWACTNRPIVHVFNSNFTFAESTRVYVEQPALEQSIFSAWYVIVLIVIVIVLFGGCICYQCYARFIKKKTSQAQEEPNNLTTIWICYCQKCLIRPSMRGPSVRNN